MAMLDGLVSFESLAAAHASLVDAARAELVRLVASCLRRIGQQRVEAEVKLLRRLRQFQARQKTSGMMRIDLRTDGMWRRIGI